MDQQPNFAPPLPNRNAPNMNPQSGGNPLSKHFRQPAMYIKLTSEGRFWPDGALEIGATGEIPVYPMTAKDEIMLRTPDGLLNGTSVVEVIQSCCPNIKNAWAMPSVDVDSTLIAIRIASYGPTMSVETKCTHCNEESEYDIDLRVARDNVQMPDYSDVVKTPDGLTIRLRPLRYDQVTKTGTTTFEEERMINALADPNIDEKVRNAEFSKHIQTMIELNNDNIANCTESIEADGTVVTDQAFIREYYQNADGNVLRQIQAKIKTYTDVVSLKAIDATCSACGKGFQFNIEFDYARFFANGF